MMIIDTHSHLNFKAFEDDRDTVAQKTLAENVWMVNVGTKYETSKSAVELAKNQERGVFAAVGLHPMYAAAEFLKLRTDPDEGEFLIKEQEFDKEKYKKLVLSGGQKVVAIGEIGLDYYYRPKTSEKVRLFKEKQKRIFSEQLDLAKEMKLPVILHCRVAHRDLLEVLESRITNYELRGVIHCFTGTVEEMDKYVSLGFYIGINGIIFKLPLDEVVKRCPTERMLVETDCPYLTPPMAESARNEPVFIKHTIKKIAELKNTSFEEICQKTTQNAKKLFKI